MKFFETRSIAITAFFISRLSAAADSEYIGCYNSFSFGLAAEDAFQSRGSCQISCVDDITNSNNTVMAMTTSVQCYCGDKLPTSADKVDDDKCNEACAGYKQETCGDSLGWYFSIYSTGLVDVDEIEEAESPASKSSSAASATGTGITTTLTGPVSGLITASPPSSTGSVDGVRYIISGSTTSTFTRANNGSTSTGTPTAASVAESASGTNAAAAFAEGAWSVALGLPVLVGMVLS